MANWKKQLPGLPPQAQAPRHTHTFPRQTEFIAAQVGVGSIWTCDCGQDFEVFQVRGRNDALGGMPTYPLGDGTILGFRPTDQ